MADKVMRTEQPFIHPKLLPITPVQRKCAACEEEKKIQRKEKNLEVNNTGKELESYTGSLNSSGKALPNEVRNFYEPRFGYDFSNVRVHTDSNAAKSAQSINALAYTAGNNIVFNKGQYEPNSEKGKRLLGHELTHVMQQTTAPNNDNPVQRSICTAPSVLLNMAGLPGTFGTISSIAGQVAEVFIMADYCKTGCAPYITEYFDDGFPSNYIAFLAAHNPHLDVTQLALMAVTGGFQRPDILVDKGAQKEMYEIKPRSPDGLLAGLSKLLNLQAFMTVFSLPYITGVIYTPSNPVASVDVAVAGYNLTVSIEATRVAPGLIVYEFCFSEDLAWAILLAALIIALLLLAPEVAAGLAGIGEAIEGLIPVLEGAPELMPLLESL